MLRTLQCCIKEFYIFKNIQIQNEVKSMFLKLKVCYLLSELCHLEILILPGHSLQLFSRNILKIVSCKILKIVSL